MRSACSTAALALAIITFPLGSAYSVGEIPQEKLGHFAIPRAAEAPKIDGKIDPEEWGNALAIGGLASQNPGGNLLIMRPTTFFLTWDAENIYLACRTWLMPGYKPRVSGREHNTVTAFDDGMEFNLLPMGKNLEVSGSDSSYKFFLNALGVHGDMGRVSVGQIFRTWQPKFDVAVRQTEPGSAPLEGSWWEAEVVFPIKDFGYDGPNVPGDEWKMLLAFNHIPAWMQASVPINSGYFDPGGYPTFVLTGGTPAVQVTMDALPGLLDGVAAAKIQVSNPGSAPATVSAVVQIGEQGEAGQFSEIFRQEKTLEVAPGETGEWVVQEKLPSADPTKLRDVFIEVKKGDLVLYRYYAYLKEGYGENWVKFTPPEEAFPFTAGFNPVRGNLRVQADSYYLPDPAMAARLHYSIQRDGDAKPLLEGNIEEAKHYYFADLLELPDLKDGEYTVTTTLELKDGSKLGPQTATFRKLDESVAFKEWWNNDLGRLDRVIPPFTKLVLKSGNEVQLWGRVYELDSLGMPAAIASQDASVMAAPARVVVTVDGQEQTVPLTRKPKVGTKKDWIVEFTGEASVANLKFITAGRVEQDGLVTIDLTYESKNGEPVKIDALRLEFPIRPEVAESLVCIGAGGNYASHTAALLPKDKSGQLWSTLDTGIGGSMMTVGSFYPQVWLGNEQRGFLWTADSDQGWTPVNDVPAHEVLREGEAIVLRNNIISRPETLSGARTLTFSYNASPFRPQPNGWRMSMYSEDGTFQTPGHKMRTDPKTGQEVNGWNWLNPPSTDPTEWAGLWAEFKEKADAKVHEQQWSDPAGSRNKDWVHTSIPMYGYGAQTSDSKVTSYFAPEWGVGNYNPSMTNFLLWLADRNFSEGGLRTIYWDIFYTGVFNEIQAGYGYELPDGRIQPTYHGQNLRTFMMRLYALMHDHGLTPGANVTHSSNAFPLIAFPWIDAVLDGEFVFFRDSTVGDFYDFYPVERMRAMAVGQNWGPQISWMLLNHVTNPEVSKRHHRTFIDWQRMHDTWRGQDNRVPPDTILEWGLNDESLEYQPYWRENGVTSADGEMLVSAWTSPDRAILVAFSTSPLESGSKDTEITIDLKALGLLAKTPWEGGVVIKEIGAHIGGGKPLDTPNDPPVTYDAASGKVSIPGLKPRTARYIGVRVQEKADIERLQHEFASIGAEGALDDDMLDWGIASPQTKQLSAAKVSEVFSSPSGTEVHAWKMGDRALLAVKNTGTAPVSPLELKVDLAALNLKPELPWQEFLRVRGFHDGKASLDFHKETLTIPTIAPGQTTWVGLRRY